MAFVFHQKNPSDIKSVDGEGLGYGNIYPSLSIEFDV
jgi:hypothetical protein